ncbi:Ethylene-insensitive protein 2 [Striga hermonthica]|uniref:Ethylene-insensitive protein 2 n=1 Tax=Striga hermonthica TaxID=68872 RepID=A0A9N7NAW5_STRHE|nr:Ethylene-insensitive protein 2 [Striga hermonthica]
MEKSEACLSYQPSTRDRVFAAAGPVLWVAVSYVDPGKWAAFVEGGARFGFDLSLIVLVINCAAILCQYLSARVAIATKKNLAQICSEEYDELTCLILGIQAEISMLVLDLTMVLGTAYGFHAVFGIDLLISVFLTGFHAVLFPFIFNFLENPKAKNALIFSACFILASYGIGVLISQPESSLSSGWMLTKLTGENAYALMSVLGANIMPHNFYLHSSIVQQDQRPTYVSQGTLCHDHFFATLWVFSGIYLVNFMLMSSAANVYYGSGLISLTLQDALTLMDQQRGFRSSLVASITLIFIIFFSNQLVAAKSSLGQQMTVYSFVRFEISGRRHRATIKLIAILTALFCVQHSGAEAIFQLLIFAQVMVGLLLPSSVIPLFRVASSRSIMGAYTISRPVEFLALLSFLGVLGIMIVFFTELLFGSSDWVISLKWNIESSVPISYIILLIASFASMSSMIWLSITPLKSETSGRDTQALNWGRTVTVSSVDRNQARITEQSHFEKPTENQEFMSSLRKSFENNRNLSTRDSDLNLPKTLLYPKTNNRLLTTIEESKPKELANVSELTMSESDEIVKSELPDDATSNSESKEMVEKTLKIEDVTHPSLTSEGPGSYKSLNGNNDEIGSNNGSHSRLLGLGRSARRQLAAILNEFWGQLFDYHGQPTTEAKTMKLDVLLGIESKIDPNKPSFAPVKLESVKLQRTSDRLNTSSFYGPSVTNIGSTLGIQPGLALWSNQMQMPNAYMQGYSPDSLDSSERRYRSMHVPSSYSVCHDQQPATFHGYGLASYADRVAKEKGHNYPKGQVESLDQTSSIKSNTLESYSQPLGLKPHNGMRTMKPPGFHNVPIARNSSMKSQRAFNEPSPERPMYYSNNNNPHNVKKFHSLPAISRLHAPQQDSSFDKNSKWQNNLMGYGQSVNHPAMASGASGFKENSTPRVCRDAFSLQIGSGSGSGSFYSRQPYEQFGVADKFPLESQIPASAVDMEAKLLQSFRICVMKLLNLEGSESLFGQNGGVDEELIDRVAARERLRFEAETRTVDLNLSCAIKIDETDHSKFMSVPNCGDGCVWRVELIVSFGVWSIRRILEHSLLEKRPELWGKYTYVLNLLQGIIDLAFSKPRSPISPCLCLQLPADYPQKLSQPISNQSNFTTAAMLLDVVKRVEAAMSCRKGRTGTTAGDVAYPKGKGNLAPVLKRPACFLRTVKSKQGHHPSVVPGLPRLWNQTSIPFRTRAVGKISR